MNLSLAEGYQLAESVKSETKVIKPAGTDIVLCTPFIHLKGVSDIVQDSGIATGAQNCSNEKSGAFTGEISASMIKSAGARWVIIGHSERRSLFAETDNLVLRKTSAAIESGLRVIFCCGEVLAERERNDHFRVVKRQLDEGLLGLQVSDFSKTVIAYEPVWAIGTGVTASPIQAQEMHGYIRSLVQEAYGTTVARETLILYGGSCKASNAAEIFSMPDVDGGLIGGASLNSAEFAGIIRAAEL